MQAGSATPEGRRVGPTPVEDDGASGDVPLTMFLTGEQVIFDHT
ncbi:MAG TPA: hypothetical protein VJX68_17155 [Candidatus Binatus sp.]|nr:hypothetical protein [Candidatus Binatus sp.]HKN14919.1 hypothetical protein [Candidatus Binatus sp.]